MEKAKFMDMQSLLSSLNEFMRDVLFKEVPKIIIALIVLWVGLKIVKLIVKALHRMMEKRNVEVSLQSFLLSMTDIALKIMVVIAVMGMVGIQTTSFIAVLGAAGLAVGMALQGTLQNFAGGVIILLLKPFRVGDYIDSPGVQGTVKSIHIFNTIVETPDKKIVVAPNTDLATKTLVNYSRSENRRVDVKVGIAYGESVDNARAVLMELARNYPLVIENPEPAVVVTALADSAVSLELRVWVKNADYWTCFFYMNQAVYDKLNEVGIQIPFNQMDVHIISKE